MNLLKMYWNRLFHPTRIIYNGIELRNVEKIEVKFEDNKLASVELTGYPLPLYKFKDSQ
jgi:hypothetical protein